MGSTRGAICPAVWRVFAIMGLGRGADVVGFSCEKDFSRN